MLGKIRMTRPLALMVTQEDYDLLYARYVISTSHSFSAFCREILLSQPVTVLYHNISADEFLVIALEMKRELEEVIAKLHQDATPESPLTLLIEKVDELKLIMHQIYQQWSSI
jgi:hypothetical protein